MPIRSRRTTAVAGVLLVAVAAAGLGVWLLQPDSSPSKTTDPVVAILNNDTGTTSDRIVKGLKATPGFEWTVPSGDQADNGRYAATVTLPSDLTAAVASLNGPAPQRATVTVTGTDDVASRLSDLIATQIRSQGIDGALSTVTAAHNSLSALTLNTQLLSAGIHAAKAGTGEFSNGVTELNGYLSAAKDGSAQLADATAQLASVVNGATAQAGPLAASLSRTGLTVGQVTDDADRVSTGLDQAITALHSAPVPLTPDQSRAVARLEGIRGLAHQSSTQLHELSTTLGAPVDPNTDLGRLLTDVVGQLTGASGQLSDGAQQLSSGLAQLSDQGGAQLTDASTQLAGGIGQLERISTALGDQVKKGLAAVPARSAAQQSSLAGALSDPVTVQHTAPDPGNHVSVSTILAIVFAASTALLAVAYVRRLLVADRSRN